MLIQLDQLSSLSHCMAAQVLAGGKKGQEGAFLVSLHASPALASGSGSTSLITEAPAVYGISSLLLIYGLFLSQSGNQSDPANKGTDTTKVMVQRQELPNAVLPQEEKKNEIVLLN